MSTMFSSPKFVGFMLTCLMITSCSGGTSSRISSPGTSSGERLTVSKTSTSTIGTSSEKKQLKFQQETDASREEQRRLDLESLRQGNCLASSDGC